MSTATQTENVPQSTPGADLPPSSSGALRRSYGFPAEGGTLTSEFWPGLQNTLSQACKVKPKFKEIHSNLALGTTDPFSTARLRILYGISTEHQGSCDFFTRGPNFLLWGFLKRFIYIYIYMNRFKNLVDRV